MAIDRHVTVIFSKYVYAVQIGPDGPIKIGLSYDPRSRFAQLQSASPYELRLLGCIVGNPLVEQTLHENLAAHHIRGEWFHPAPAVLDWCRSLLTAPRLPYDVRRPDMGPVLTYAEATRIMVESA